MTPRPSGAYDSARSITDSLLTEQPHYRAGQSATGTGPHFGLLAHGPQAPHRGNCLLVAVVGVVAVALGSIYVAMGRVRPFYQQAIRLDPQKLEVGSRELESRATALYSEARQPGQWQAAFTAEQINGWLALQLAEVYGDALPKDISEPRVAIDDDRFTLGFRARRGGVETVVSADASVMLTESGEIAIRLLSVQAGALPLPVMQIADEVSQACQELSLPVRWTQDGGAAGGTDRREPGCDESEANSPRCGRLARRDVVCRRPHRG